MKITIYALHLGYGGVEKYVCTIANILCEQHDVEIIATYQMCEQPAFPLDSRVHVQYLMKEKPNKQQLKEAIASKHPIRILKEGIYACKVLYLKKRRNIKSMKNCQSDVVISTRCFHNMLIGKYCVSSIIKITGEHNHPNNQQAYIDQVVASCKGFDYFIPISHELCQLYEPKMKQIGVETKWIRFCIDAHEGKKISSFTSPSLVYVGRLSKEKGVFDLLQVFALVHQEKSDAFLHIIGDGECMGEMKQKAAMLNLEDHICFHGFQDKDFIYDCLSEASLFIMTSYTESFGIVLLEAMSCGVPCIAYDSAQGAHEIIQNGCNGYLIENRDNQRMKNVIIDLLQHPDMLRKLSKEALHTADLYSYEKTKQAWLAFMRQAAKKEDRL